MTSFMTSFLGVPADAAYHFVVSLTHVLTPALGGLAAAAGIVVFTMAVRLLIAPLSFRALRGQAAQARLTPQMQALRQRYGRQPERLQRELTALYRREGTSMLAGIWPVLAQWPFLSVMYLLFRSSRVAGGPNQLLAHTLFGVRLGASWLSGAGALSAQGGIFLAAFAVLAALCWLSARVARRMTTAMRPAPAQPANNSKKRREETAARPVGAPGGGAVTFLSNVLPYVTVVIAAFAPLAAGIYLITTMAWSLAERGLFLRSRSAAARPD